MNMERSCGLLTHISSLPTGFGIGDFGPSAYYFLKIISEMGIKKWQILPLNPTAGVMYHSPYSSYSAFALNCLFISPELMRDDGLITQEELDEVGFRDFDKVDYTYAEETKKVLFEKAYDRFIADFDKQDFDRFCWENSFWLNDHAVFTAIKSQFNCCWIDWPDDLKYRSGLDAYINNNLNIINKEKFLQYIAAKQWFALKSKANEAGIKIFGDLPIYVTFDSVDVWKSPDQFQLDDKYVPIEVAGVPPDYFSETGQLWGNPLYDWETMKSDGFDWWLTRIRHSLNLYDIIRIDHFRGMVGYWAVPNGEKTAIKGTWKKVPVYELFDAVKNTFPELPIVAEDLGLITQDVRDVMSHFGLPGMRVLMFAFGSKDPVSLFLPHNYIENCIAYTGTHDNNTLKGWFKEETDELSRKQLSDYIGKEITEENVHWEMIRVALQSHAGTVVLPMQDILGKDATHRMNTPSTVTNNWSWMLDYSEIDGGLINAFSGMLKMYERI